MSEKILEAKRIGFIGAGNMAEALISGLIDSGEVRPKQISIGDIDQKRLDYMKATYAVSPVEDNRKIVESSDVVLVAVKPQQIEEALQGVDRSIHEGTVVISVAAGTPTAKLESLTGPKAKIVRAMPNTPALKRQGMTAIYPGPRSGREEQGIAEAIFGAVGKTIVVESESLIDAATALSGSGPAYLFYFAELMIEAGREIGFEPEVAEELVYQTWLGSTHLLLESNLSAAELRRRVTSPGGTTEAALKVFESKGIRAILREAIRKAFERSQELTAR